MLTNSFRHTFIAVVLLLVSSLFAAAQARPGDIIVQDNSAPPQLFFACDRPTSELKPLFTPGLIADLRQINAGVALSTEDFSSQRAQLVQALNRAGVPAIAWLVLRHDDGYYVNARNTAQTTARFEEFDRWTVVNGLHWQAVGLDIEPTFSDFTTLGGSKWRMLSLILRRAFDRGRVEGAQASYGILIRQMQARGYNVQTYQLMFLADERRAHSTLLERVFGIVNVRGNDEILMLYTSFNHAAGAGTIWEYGPDAQTIAVGSTAPSGDKTADAKFPPLNWDEFSRDLIVARHFSPKLVGVYSLEGCVHQGFMAKLKTLDWNQKVIIPADSVHKAKVVRNFMFGMLWFGSHLIYFVVAFVILFAWLARFFVRRRRRKRMLARA